MPLGTVGRAFRRPAEPEVISVPRLGEARVPDGRERRLPSEPARFGTGVRVVAIEHEQHGRLERRFVRRGPKHRATRSARRDLAQSSAIRSDGQERRPVAGLDAEDDGPRGLDAVTGRHPLDGGRPGRFGRRWWDGRVRRCGWARRRDRRQPGQTGTAEHGDARQRDGTDRGQGRDPRCDRHAREPPRDHVPFLWRRLDGRAGPPRRRGPAPWSVRLRSTTGRRVRASGRRSCEASFLGDGPRLRLGCEGVAEPGEGVVESRSGRSRGDARGVPRSPRGAARGSGAGRRPPAVRPRVGGTPAPVRRGPRGRRWHPASMARPSAGPGSVRSTGRARCDSS